MQTQQHAILLIMRSRIRLLLITAFASSKVGRRLEHTSKHSRAELNMALVLLRTAPSTITVTYYNDFTNQSSYRISQFLHSTQGSHSDY